jgi:hypothetical protein
MLDRRNGLCDCSDAFEVCGLDRLVRVMAKDPATKTIRESQGLPPSARASPEDDECGVDVSGPSIIALQFDLAFATALI